MCGKPHKPAEMSIVNEVHFRKLVALSVLLLPFPVTNSQIYESGINVLIQPSTRSVELMQGIYTEFFFIYYKL